ncbi:MAG: AlbA family DNA-binding domain-containing protein, partial [Thermoplasmatota archaeon]
QRLKDWCASGVDPHPKVEVARAVQEDKSILVVRVPDGSDKPYQLRNRHRFYVRRQDRDMPATKADLDSIYASKQEMSGTKNGFAW